MLDLFAYAEERKLPTPDMHRKRDRATPIKAAHQIAQIKSPLQEDILAAFKELGPMTDGELEMLERFSHLGRTTARGRRKELRNMGLIEDTGEVRKCGRSSMTVWRAVSTAAARQTDFMMENLKCRLQR